MNCNADQPLAANYMRKIDSVPESAQHYSLPSLRSAT